MFILIVCGVGLAGLLLYYPLDDLYCIYWKRQPPGPISLPLIGGLYKLDKCHIRQSLNTLTKRYGHIFSLRMGPLGRAIFISDLKLVQLVTGSPYMNDRPKLPVFKIIDPSGDGIGSCNYDDRWKLMTKTIQRGMAKLMQNSGCPVTNTFTNYLLKRFEAVEGVPYNPRRDLKLSIIGLFHTLIYGEEIQDLDSPILNTKLVNHELVMQILSPLHPVNIIPSFWWNLPLTYNSAIKQIIQKKEETLVNILKEKRENFSGHIEDMMDVVAEFAINQSEAGTKHGVITTDMMSSTWAMYMAALDTTVDTTLWCIQTLCEHTDIQDKIRQELLEIGDEDKMLANRADLNYTRAAILECMRMTSSVIMGLPHENNRDIVLGGYNVPKGTMILQNQEYIHFTEDLWDEPQKMKPERFLNAEGKTMNTSQLKQTAFINFSIGRRPCIGQHVALDVILIIIAKIFRRYQLSFPPGFTPNREGELGLNLRPCPFEIILHAK